MTTDRRLSTYFLCYVKFSVSFNDEVSSFKCPRYEKSPSILNKYEDTKRILAMCEKVYLAKRLDATPCFQIVFNDDYFWL